MPGQPPMPQLSDEELAKDQSPQLLAVFIIFTILPIVALSLRFIARRVTHQRLWVDDWLLAPAVVLCIVQLGFLIEAIHYGLGRHQQAVSQTGENVAPYLMYTYLSELYYATAVTLIKLSILFLYKRIFSINRTFKKTCYAMMAFVLTWGVAVFFTTVFQCTPVRAAWVKTIEGLQCFDLADFVIGSNVPNIIADAVIIAMPFPLVWKLKVSVLRRVGLIALFFVAAITMVISILRCYFNAHIDTMDPTWNFINVAIFSTVEVSVGVCCACMPVIYPLFRTLVGRRILNSSQRSTGNGYSSPEPMVQKNSTGGSSDEAQLYSSSGRGGRADDFYGHESDEGVPMGHIGVPQETHQQR